MVAVACGCLRLVAGSAGLRGVGRAGVRARTGGGEQGVPVYRRGRSDGLNVPTGSISGSADDGSAWFSDTKFEAGPTRLGARYGTAGCTGVPGRTTPAAWERRAQFSIRGTAYAVELACSQIRGVYGWVRKGALIAPGSDERGGVSQNGTL